MIYRNTIDHYGPLVMRLHWLMLLQLIGVYATINLHDFAAKGSVLRADLKLWHFMLGLSVLALVLVRISARLSSGPTPPIKPALPHWQKLLAVTMHLTLYLFMLIMPILGWLIVSAEGEPVVVLGMQLPALIAPDKALYDSLKDIHETIGTIGYYLIGLHATAGLLHHYALRDNTLQRMLPRRSRIYKPPLP